MHQLFSYVVVLALFYVYDSISIRLNATTDGVSTVFIWVIFTWVVKFTRNLKFISRSRCFSVNSVQYEAVIIAECG